VTNPSPRSLCAAIDEAQLVLVVTEANLRVAVRDLDAQLDTPPGVGESTHGVSAPGWAGLPMRGVGWVRTFGETRGSAGVFRLRTADGWRLRQVSE
jgi:hypothetical protein